ncbi:MAG: hypothetical protein GX455_01610, partial [Phycisphaerae bacterium]|nr:hypothetical protein [Phycisphaerae bacterium]
MMKRHCCVAIIVTVLFAVIGNSGICLAADPEPISVTYTLATEQDRSPISPYIYGSNSSMPAADNIPA